MADTNVDVLRRLLRCSVCLNDFCQPKFLHCGHSFCKVCLEHILQLSTCDDKLTCPQCREQTWIPNGLENLKNDFRISQIRASVEGLDSRVDVDYCACCKGPDSAVFCVQCHVSICRKCLENHGQRYVSHKVLLRSNLKQCRHHAQLCTLFCVQCMSAICTCCAFQQCQGHETQDIPDVTCVEQAADVQKYVDLTERYFNERSQDIKDDFNGIQLKVRGHFEQIHQKLRSRCDYLLYEVDSARKSILGKLESARDKQLNILNAAGARGKPDTDEQTTDRDAPMDVSGILSALAVPRISMDAAFIPHDSLELGQLCITCEESTIDSTPLSRLEEVLS